MFSTQDLTFIKKIKFPTRTGHTSSDNYRYSISQEGSIFLVTVRDYYKPHWGSKMLIDANGQLIQEYFPFINDEGKWFGSFKIFSNFEVTYRKDSFYRDKQPESHLILFNAKTQEESIIYKTV